MVSLPETKWCSGCKRSLPSSAYNRSRYRHDGLQPTCRECEKAERAARYRRHREHDPRKRRAYNRPAADGKICSKCGALRPLAEYVAFERPGKKTLYAGQCNACSAAKNSAVYHERRQERLAAGWHPTMLPKTCTKCHVEKPARAFAVNLGRVDGRLTVCTACAMAGRCGYCRKKTSGKFCDDICRARKMDSDRACYLVRMPSSAPTEKLCGMCRIIKPANDFYRHRRMHDGLANGCKACKDADIVARYAALRHAAVAAYGSACVDCGERDEVVLEFDHPNNDGKNDRAKPMTVLRERVRFRPDNVVLRCANCHKARHHPKPGKKHSRAVLALGGHCAACGDANELHLEVDHIHGGGHREYTARPGAHIDRALRGDSDLQCLCRNCQVRKRKISPAEKPPGYTREMRRLAKAG